MMKYRVRNVEQAYAYILDCNLATVDDMAMKKSRKKVEFARQISIAQTALDWAIEMGVDVSTTRGDDVMNKFNGSVDAYAKDIVERFGK